MLFETSSGIDSGICLDEDPQLQYFEQPVCENFLSIGTGKCPFISYNTEYTARHDTTVPLSSLSSGEDPDWESNITE